MESIEDLQKMFSGIYSLSRLLKSVSLSKEEVYSIIGDDREIDYGIYNLFKADDNNWDMNPYETTMYAKYGFLFLDYHNRTKKSITSLLVKQLSNAKASANNLDLDKMNLQDCIQTSLNGRVYIIEEPYDDYGALQIAIDRDLFDLIPIEMMHGMEYGNYYICANEEEIDFLVDNFCLNRDELDGYDYFRFIIKE